MRSCDEPMKFCADPDVYRSPSFVRPWDEELVGINVLIFSEETTTDRPADDAATPLKLEIASQTDYPPRQRDRRLIMQTVNSSETEYQLAAIARHSIGAAVERSIWTRSW